MTHADRAKLDELVDRQEADWPPAVVHDVLGWRLRATAGVQRRRSTSARPLDHDGSPQELDRVLATAAAWAQEHRQPLSVQVADWQLGLSAALADRGWVPEQSADVMTVAADRVAGPAPSVTSGLDEAWREVHQAVEGRADDAATAAQVHRRLGGRARFLQVPGVAVALVVDSPQHVGVFSVSTRPEHRGRGHATELLRAAAQGEPGRTLYLQVWGSNPAVRLYEQLGLRRRYRYRYWSPGPSCHQ